MNKNIKNNDILIIKELLTDKYYNSTFRINPFILNNDNYGNLCIDQNKLDKIKNNLINKKYVKKNSNICIFRNMHYNCETKNIIQKNILDIKHNKCGMIIISKDKKLESDSFPIINKYHKEFTKTIVSYKINSIILSLITESNKYNYVELQFKFNQQNKITSILKDLQFIYSSLLN